MKALAFDVGGTKIYSAVIDDKGNFVTEVEKHSTPRDLGKIREIFLSVNSKTAEEGDFPLCRCFYKFPIILSFMIARISLGI